MRAYYCDHFELPLPDGHRFPMQKYRLLRERVARAGIVDLRVPEAATRQQLETVHTTDYVGRLYGGSLSRDEVRRIGFPFSVELVERSRRSVGGTISASHAALTDGIAINLAGGTHHGFPGHGEGFCVFNDVAVAIRTHQAVGSASRFAVLDLDVHQGNGTARIFCRDDTVFTLSIHGENNYPFRKESSDLDVELPDGCGDQAYLDAAERGVRAALANAPELAFYLAGADPYEHDRLGRLGLTKEGLAERDELVFDHCARAGVPVAVVMSGGYAVEVVDTVDIHEHTVRAAARRSRTEILT